MVLDSVVAPWVVRAVQPLPVRFDSWAQVCGGVLGGSPVDVSDAMVKVALEWIEKNYGAEVRAAVEETDTDPVRFRNGAVAYRKRFKSKISSTESTGAEVFGNISPETVKVQYEHLTAEVSETDEED